MLIWIRLQVKALYQRCANQNLQIATSHKQRLLLQARQLSSNNRGTVVPRHRLHGEMPLTLLAKQNPNDLATRTNSEGLLTGVQTGMVIYIMVTNATQREIYKKAQVIGLDWGVQEKIPKTLKNQ